jgi:hypothetical protein
MEQKSNALALEKLGYGTAAKKFDIKTLEKWLPLKPPAGPRYYPDVAKALVNWLMHGGSENINELQQQLWRETIAGEVQANGLLADLKASMGN